MPERLPNNPIENDKLLKDKKRLEEQLPKEEQVLTRLKQENERRKNDLHRNTENFLGSIKTKVGSVERTIKRQDEVVQKDIEFGQSLKPEKIPTAPTPVSKTTLSPEEEKIEWLKERIKRIGTPKNEADKSALMALQDNLEELENGTTNVSEPVETIPAGTFKAPTEEELTKEKTKLVKEIIQLRKDREMLMVDKVKQKEIMMVAGAYATQTQIEEIERKIQEKEERLRELRGEKNNEPAAEPIAKPKAEKIEVAEAWANLTSARDGYIQMLNKDWKKEKMKEAEYGLALEEAEEAYEEAKEAYVEKAQGKDGFDEETWREEEEKLIKERTKKKKGWKKWLLGAGIFAGGLGLFGYLNKDNEKEKVKDEKKIEYVEPEQQIVKKDTVDLQNEINKKLWEEQQKKSKKDTATTPADTTTADTSNTYEGMAGTINPQPEPEKEVHNLNKSTIKNYTPARGGSYNLSTNPHDRNKAYPQNRSINPSKYKPHRKK